MADDAELQKAIAASLADQDSKTDDDDLKRALEASKGEEDAALQRALKESTTPTDLNALTAQEQDAMTVAQLNGILEEVNECAMVGEPQGVAEALAAEYADNPQLGFQRGIGVLDGRYRAMRRVRKDGNCFYRGFLYRYLEDLCVQQMSYAIANQGGALCPELERVVGVVRGSKEELMKVGYDETVVESFWETLLELLESLPTKTTQALHAQMNEENGVAMHVVWFMRLLSSCQIKRHADRFAPFVMDEDGNADVAAFCQREVEPVNHECDQVQIIALTEMLGVPVAIEYLDASGTPSAVVFPEGSEPVVSLLYRPGHYDVLYPKEEALGS